MKLSLFINKNIDINFHCLSNRIHEATEVENDYRTLLLPNLLEDQQSRQEQIVSIW